MGTSEPALIDPSLSAKPNAFGASQSVPHYSPSYRALNAAQRGRYLTWLAGGRSDPSIEIGFVLLFFYGLERRVVVDILMNDVREPELPAIRAAVADLSERYGRTYYMVGYYAKSLLDLIDALLAQQTDRDLPEIPLNSDRYSVPLVLRIALGSRATAGLPITSDLALAWAWYDPHYNPRTPAIRCPDEFARLWHLRFEQTFPHGLTVAGKKARVRLTYTAANQGIRHVAVRLEDVPDVFIQKIPASKLIRLFEEVTTELDRYSRWLATNPYRAGTLQGVAMLPAVLIDPTDKTVEPVIQWANALLGSRSLAKTTGAELIRLWGAEATGKLIKSEASALARLLGQLGFGIEPDSRVTGAQLLAETPVVLFRSPLDPTDAAETPSPAYSFAILFAHLARVVSLADGEISYRETDLLGDHLESALGLDPEEKARFHAHLLWLTLVPVKLTGLTKRISEIDRDLRSTLGNLLILVAAADGIATPNEVTVLTKIFHLLELDPALVMDGLHAALTQSTSPATRPVTVRHGTTPDPGYDISPPTSTRSRRTGRTGQRVASSPPVAPSITLDESVIAAKVVDSNAVSALLGNIFADDDDRPAPTTNKTTPPPLTDSPPTINGLDGPHSLLLRALAQRAEWSRAEFEALATEYHVLPDGAIDLINEAAIEATDEPLLEGDDILSVNSEILEHLLA